MGLRRTWPIEAMRATRKLGKSLRLAIPFEFEYTRADVGNYILSKMPEYDELTIDATAVRGAMERSKALIARLDDAEVFVESAVNIANSLDRLAVQIFSQSAELIIDWERRLSTPPQMLFDGSAPEKIGDLIVAAEASQDQIQTQIARVENCCHRSANVEVQSIGLVVRESLARMFNIFEHHRWLALEAQADSDIDAGHVKKFGNARSVVAHLRRAAR